MAAFVCWKIGQRQYYACPEDKQRQRVTWSPEAAHAVAPYWGVPSRL